MISSSTPTSLWVPQMMATGEVMSIGNSFEAAMMKAVSSIRLGGHLTHKPFEATDEWWSTCHVSGRQ